ncbi:hypothetical protein AAGV33_15010 [Flavobacterium sp. FBOR7N2.3]|uniref:DUF4199 domain-containing protein n=1 Tax=Flavobacterium magnesitis TaxID=3138077 RepID=A0ABV4TP51_9FLAO
MENLIYSISLLLVIILIFFPSFLIYRLKKQYSEHVFTFYIVSGVIISSILMLVVAWWSYFSCEILLSYYGYDFELMMNNKERLKNVSPENLDKVKLLNQKRMGIGWPLKAIFGEIIYIPYLLIVYLLTFLYTKIRMKKKS